MQSFPAFGVERRGAPVTAFTRIDDSPIFLRCNIYTPDIIVVMDPTLLREAGVTTGLKENGMVIVNAVRDDLNMSDYEGFFVASVDATSIAVRRRLGTNTNPIVNTAILGAFARATGLVNIESVVQSISAGVPQKPEANAAAAREAYDETQTPTKAMKE